MSQKQLRECAKYCKKCCANRKKHQMKNSKKRNLAAANFSDFDDTSQQHIREQVQQVMEDALFVLSSSYNDTIITQLCRGGRIVSVGLRAKAT